MNKLSEITNLKILILEHGIMFKPINLFSSVNYYNKYKMKTIYKHPVSNGKEVYDISDDMNLVPTEILLKFKGKEALVKCRFNEKSPVELVLNHNCIKLMINGRLSLVNCELVPIYSFLKTKIDEDHYVEDYVDIVGMDRISILLYEGCYNWVCGKQCKFCDLHPKKNDEKTARPTINMLYKFNNANEWWDYYRNAYFDNIKKSLDIILKQKELKHKHLFIMAGNLTNSKMTWRCLLELTRFLNDNYDMSIFDSIANVCPHPDLKSLKLLKEYGIKQIQYNLEVSNKNLFVEMCPGKMSFDLFCNKLFEAVKVLGEGNVRTNMVLGLQKIDELLKDAKIFAESGIVFDYSVFQPKKYTPLENYSSPNIEDIIIFSIELAKIYKKYNFKPIFCPISSRSSIINEVFNDIG